jgi:hypothetical protein
MEAWSTIVISFLTSAGVTGGIMKLISSRIEHKYQKIIEAYKHELSAISEQQKFNYQRWITDFGLFTQKKHEVYSELYRLLLIADGSLESLFGLMHVPSFDEYSREDMEKYLLNYQVVEGYVPQLVEGWDTSRDTCVHKIRDYLTIIDFQKADKARNEAKNYFLINSLYFSEKAEALVSELLSLLVNQYVIDYQNRVEHIRDEVGLAERKTIRQKKPEVLGKLKAAMSGEISAGYYDAKSEDTQS